MKLFRIPFFTSSNFISNFPKGLVEETMVFKGVFTVSKALVEVTRVFKGVFTSLITAYQIIHIISREIILKSG